ncbi:DsbC family protein [Campylobacter helveticus]|uniref:DsbC family protein n=1 Tax=Campylobacter helveticus TaxID=28898 RepID=UPI0009C2882E|nr:DsbC family protein [Campylobacter helveticus]ARE80665.1 putative thioredoxin-like protein, DsbA family [Campylobacter helveticus]MCR2061711.1 DsbC family protein [Campylobacter helveticus]TNH34789.1 DsbC family protein [Campylobacter helveticus]TNH37054.1 DsbC family protein [Campylobacter helveticus]TXK51625.1 DsbC family protein [Campylobacter helveticus]
MQTLSKITLSSLLLISSLSAVTLIEEQEEALVKGVIPSTKIEKVQRAEVDGFYKAYLANGNILYVNPFKRVIFIGELYTNTGVSLTANEREAWQSELSAAQIKDMDLKELTQYAKKLDFNQGSKKYDFVLFTDPECPFCARVEEHFMKNNVSVYINFYPLSFHQNATKWILQILSSKDFKEAFVSIRHNQKDLDVKTTKEAEQTLNNMKALGEKLNIQGTPKLFVVEKNTSKIIDVIDGANMQKIDSYLTKDKQ